MKRRFEQKELCLPSFLPFLSHSFALFASSCPTCRLNCSNSLNRSNGFFLIRAFYSPSALFVRGEFVSNVFCLPSFLLYSELIYSELIKQAYCPPVCLVGSLRICLAKHPHSFIITINIKQLQITLIIYKVQPRRGLYLSNLKE